MSVKAVIILVSALSIVFAVGATGRWLYNAGVSSERRKQVETSLNRNSDRNKDDEEIRKLEMDGMCREFGASRWVPERNGCE